MERLDQLTYVKGPFAFGNKIQFLPNKNSIYLQLEQSRPI